MSRAWRILAVALIGLAALMGCTKSPKSEGVRLMKAQPGPVDQQVRALLKGGGPLVVYVGATWCEPCRYFHDAAARGDLDETFPDLTILEFDYDEDIERLDPAGYGSNMIPLFAIPKADGTASERRFQGSKKGPKAVQNIVPRLQRLLQVPPP